MGSTVFGHGAIVPLVVVCYADENPLSAVLLRCSEDVEFRALTSRAAPLLITAFPGSDNNQVTIVAHACRTQTATCSEHKHATAMQAQIHCYYCTCSEHRQRNHNTLGKMKIYLKYFHYEIRRHGHSHTEQARKHEGNDLCMLRVDAQSTDESE
ncbi:hypothetical protein NDU88_007138 [Pleurodeles waltl]|uniref:Uncharacterized protein n=1 Tax=Pleurodeles waltl TaxID=8319 RepID=A0AAV7TYW1_PLEWA|nr:hypothetical protein NDU88_007138 [Pleurodeles waltl]